MTNDLIKDYTLKISQASRSEIIVILYDLSIQYLEDAKKSCESGNHSAMRENCGAAIRVINDLINALDYSYELAASLYSMYEYISKEISLAVIKDSKEKLNDPIRYLGALREAFTKVAAEDKSGPLMDNTQSVYAGLTYGKGMLNENVTAANPNRGYSV